MSEAEIVWLLTLMLEANFYWLEQEAVQVLTHLRVKATKDSILSLKPRVGKKKRPNPKRLFSDDIKQELITLVNKGEKADGKWGAWPSFELREQVVEKTGLTLIQVNNFISNYHKRNKP